MTLGLKGRIAVTAVTATATALVVVLVVAAPDLHRRSIGQVRAGLVAEARLIARVMGPPLAEGRPAAEIDALADEAAKDAGGRVTVIAPDGTVVGDSALSGAALRSVDNHGGRPEVREALAAGAGVSIRHSTTVGQDLLYAAVAVRDQGRLVGVARVARSLRGVEDQIDELQRAVTLALAVAFVITALFSAALSSSVAGPLGKVMDAARRFAAGDLSARSRVRRSDEVGELARILNRSADQLQARITEIARDRARIDAILSAMEDGVIAVDHRGVVLLANQSLRESLELDEPVGRHYLEVVRQRAVGELLESVLATAARREGEVEMLRGGGRAYAVIGVPFPGPEGQPPGAVLTFHDVTERHRVERLRRDFVANASHELRTPLTSIRGFVEALEDGAMDEPATGRRFLEKIRVHADRMASLVSDLLELSRLESGERAPAWADVAPARVAEEVATSFAEAAGRKGISLHRSDHGAPMVESDADRLRQILENLVENAVKYTPSGGRIDIATGPAAGGAELVVADDGPGIPAEHVPRIFERFYRVDKARSREMGGTGLGLSIVRHLAESIGAAVRVDSKPGHGTRFTVTLPSARERGRL